MSKNELESFVCIGCTNSDPRMLEVLEFPKIYEVECKVCSLVTYVKKERSDNESRRMSR